MKNDVHSQGNVPWMPRETSDSPMCSLFLRICSNLVSKDGISTRKSLIQGSLELPVHCLWWEVSLSANWSALLSVRKCLLPQLVISTFYFTLHWQAYRIHPRPTTEQVNISMSSKLRLQIEQAFYKIKVHQPPHVSFLYSCLSPQGHKLVNTDPVNTSLHHNIKQGKTGKGNRFPLVKPWIFIGTGKYFKNAS